MRKIAFIAPNEGVPWGASEYLWNAAAERLVRRGVEVHLSVKKWGLRMPNVSMSVPNGNHSRSLHESVPADGNEY
jgi:hypothetical protein